LKEAAMSLDDFVAGFILGLAVASLLFVAISLSL
jgi:hypothetical protein